MDGPNRRPYQPPLRRARGARPCVVHGARGRGGGDRRSVRLRQEHAAADPGWPAAASAGAAELRGAPPANSLNPLTFVFQDFALLPWCTVEDNVEFPLVHTALSAGERRAVVDDALRRTGLVDFRGAY